MSLQITLTRSCLRCFPAEAALLQLQPSERGSAWVMELSVSMYPRELQPHLQELLCRVVTGSTGAGAAVPGTTQESNNPPKAELGSGGKRHSMSQLLPQLSERHRVHLGLQFVLALSCCDPVKHERKGGRRVGARLGGCSLSGCPTRSTGLENASIKMSAQQKISFLGEVCFPWFMWPPG